MKCDSLTECGTLEFWITKSVETGEWMLGNARTSFPAYSNRLTLDAPVRLDQALLTEIVELLQSHLNDVVSSSVFSQSDFQMSLPGLALGGLRILTHVAEDRQAAANVRFVRALGDTSAVFLPPLNGRVIPEKRVEDAAVPILQELLLPALEVFDHILEHGISETHAELLRARVKTMRAKRDELSDYITLLSRYLESPDKVAAQLEKNDQDATATSDVVETVMPATERTRQTLQITETVNRPQGDMNWEPNTGVSRGNGPGILHGHHVKPKVFN